METCLDIGIKEEEFYNMTLGEVIRAIQSYNRQTKRKEKDNLTYIYLLANLVGISNSRLFSKEASYPPIDELFPEIFENEETREARQRKLDQANIAKIKLFAQSFNQRFKG